MRNVINALVANACARPDDAAFSQGEQTLTWRQLAARVAGSANDLAGRARTVGLLADNSLDWVVTDLAVAAAGLTFVPLPSMFSDSQLDHIVASARPDCILADPANMARAHRLSGCATALVAVSGDTMPDAAGAAQRIIFTSGSTGSPKGVRLGDRQIGAMVQALADAIAADENDRYLSLLPLPLLLETLCAVHVPVLVGGHSTLAGNIADAMARNGIGVIVDVFERHAPSVSVLVPELLRAWVGALRQSGRQAPSSLRFVAVGGAPVPQPVAALAWTLGIPVHEGYGLSECGSVVALNRPGARVAGTVGEPLAGTDVTIEDGEIVVRGDCVMTGYLDGAAVHGAWRTGDLGHFDAQNRLVVDGRRDNLLVLANGRNVQAEWVETTLTGDPRILRAFVTGHGASHLTAIIVPMIGATSVFSDRVLALDIVQTVCRELPAYAVPETVIVTDMAKLAGAKLLTPTGRPRRPALAAHFAGTQALEQEYAEGFQS